MHLHEARTSVRPMPEAASRAAERARPGRTGRRRGGSSRPRSRSRCPSTRTTTCPALEPRRQRDPAAGLGVLGGVGQQVDQDLLEPGRVGLEPQAAAAGDRRPGRGTAASISGRAASTARVDDRGELDRLLAELDLAPGDPRDVQQVVDEPGEVPAPAARSPPGSTPGRASEVDRSGRLDGVADRRQRVAQLVGEHRQELVLAAVGLGQLLAFGAAPPRAASAR